jgi:hypothetical protein
LCRRESRIRFGVAERNKDSTVVGGEDSFISTSSSSLLFFTILIVFGSRRNSIRGCSIVRGCSSMWPYYYVVVWMSFVAR